ncbi:ParB/RepB/Spo0J family partition protein [Clostridium tyrobutyricum]|uniref:Chromosome (Plasmid) partitioning protein ParB / Stage 0 sporulation protein J n=1 Tax=Clostridium tyrobutyricum DIVETGP TaxID=1408889 RepID=W6N678_CLOTY|nr:ParB/RepB/Spo0J family partition protein [Clostridium tyrobutyricum]AND86290.1 stage 0 sporulation protein J [Clostridium tyrobutyricum]ANP70780.1 chromosome partitioning protein ParB [Clostridium tyrobutyricum]MBR9649023.1 ParB/RepB/Spo0J family partition protein [Clostridium tyrobutyricum]MBV4416918.1 ParB/RepB/Spo0J family partition protein [Clostridium tyrobutyricum]MBV4423009.1 ParB/RepB/Spo0J family partition protein [Clostridium tyrobutyricum]
MNKKYGLGRGLGALIPDDILNNSDTETTVKKINIESISANEEQPRKNFDEGKIVQLSQSIKEHGIIQPLILNREKDKYIIVAGERRWRAARLAGLKEVPAIVMSLSDRDILEISLIENIQRQDLNPIEEAIAYKKLINDFKLKQEELANKIGKSRTAITNCMRLLNLDSRVQDYLINGLITEGHGRTLLTLEDKNSQYELAKSIIKNDLTVRQVEKLVKDIKHAKKDIGNRQIKSNPYYIDIEEKLKELFGTKVTLNDKKNKGKIEIEYYSPDDLQRILDILKV